MSNFDFSAKRVRKDGKPMSKFDIAYYLNNDVHYRGMPWTVMYDAFSYSELVDFLKQSLC